MIRFKEVMWLLILASFEMKRLTVLSSYLITAEIACYDLLIWVLVLSLFVDA